MEPLGLITALLFLTFLCEGLVEYFARPIVNPGPKHFLEAEAEAAIKKAPFFVRKSVHSLARAHSRAVMYVLFLRNWFTFL